MQPDARPVGCVQAPPAGDPSHVPQPVVGQGISRPDALLDACTKSDTAAPARGRGGPPSVPDKLAYRAAALMKPGCVDKAGTVHGFRSLAHVCETSQAFAALSNEAASCPATLLSAMRRACPALGRVQERVKAVLSERLMQQRKMLAGQQTRLPTRVRQATEYMEEASFGLSKQSGLVWVDRAKREWLVLDGPRSYSDYAWLPFCISVNYTVGAHVLTWLAGTGCIKDKGYKASATPAPSRSPADAAHAASRRCCRTAQALFAPALQRMNLKVGCWVHSLMACSSCL